jgi:hypothetical protein
LKLQRGEPGGGNRFFGGGVFAKKCRFVIEFEFGAKLDIFGQLKTIDKWEL